MNTIDLSVRLDEVGLEGPDDLLGEIRLCAGQQCIAVSPAYLDSWLVAFIEGVHGLKVKRNLQVEMLEEPSPLVFDLAPASLAIRYGDQEVLLPSLAEFADKLLNVAKEFLSRLNTAGVPLASENLRLIERFVGAPE